MLPPEAHSFPNRITLELSACCNLSCVMCPRKYVSNGNGFMKNDLFRHIVNQLKGKAIGAVVPFFRGEPLLHPDFLEMIRILKETVSAKIQLATNALLLDRYTSKYLLELGIDFISFSLDAIRKNTYESIRKGGDFTLAMENVHTFLREKANGSASATQVQVSITQTEKNYAEIPAFVEYWKGCVDRIRVYPCHSINGRFGKLNDADSNKKKTQRQLCKKPFTDFAIYYDGDIALCNHDWDRKKEHSLGSAQEKTIEDIWKDQPYKTIRRMHRSRKWDTVIPCNDCDHWMTVKEIESPRGRIIT